MSATSPDPGSVTGSGDGPPSGPTALRILVGGQLRRLREAKGISREEAGWEIRGSESKISRMELGRVSFRERDVADLLSLYGVTDPDQRSTVLSLAREANRPGWWHRYGDVQPRWFEAYLGLEGAASLIRTYELQFVPGLLQTRDYARALIRLGHVSAGAEEIERRVDLRIERQRMRDRTAPPAPHLWAVVDEAALRRPLGGPAVMREQLASLAEACTRPNITLQVVQFRTGGHPAAGGAFTLLRFDDPELPDIVYLEQLTSALYVDQRQEVDLYVEVMEQLCVAAAPPAETPAILARIAGELYG